MYHQQQMTPELKYSTDMFNKPIKRTKIDTSIKKKCELKKHIGRKNCRKAYRQIQTRWGLLWGCDFCIKDYIEGNER